MIRPGIWLIGISLLCAGCATSNGSQKTGEAVGTVLRAPVDLVTGIGRGITGKKYTPGREFRQNRQPQEADSVFWEDKDAFFSTSGNSASVKTR